ncbi:MAG: hypothetical protein COB04_04090 [Gammaproteobacteria bacterium]|nr:MAG: hypothetical protein COB04_04090 [Gammaproteobacteria bacterium]
MTLAKGVVFLAIAGLLASCSVYERFLPSSEDRPAQEFSPGENLVYQAPDRWTMSYDKKTDKHWMTGWTPEDQERDSWQDMLSIQVVYNATSKNPVQFIKGMAKSAEKACPGSKGKIWEEGERDGYQYVIWFHDCKKNPNTQQMEVSILKAMLGSDNFYVLQRAWRSEPSKSDLEQWATYLKKASICDTRFESVACPK